MPEASDDSSRIVMPESTGLVMIGRNEGARLKRALERLGRQPERCVYVDSGSTDASVAEARSFGVSVVELDTSSPFTAARGRNEGFAYLLGRWPELEYVQFLDGDCLLAPGWLCAAQTTLSNEPRLGLVTGFLRELERERSVYNRLCDIEWQGPVGEIRTCGGIAMMRAKAFREAGGMNPSLIAGEEADLHIRMRRSGWTLRRIPEVMAHHDAELTEFRQWWTRNVRAGHACAEGALRHGDSSELHNVKESRSNWLWGLAVPAGALTLATLGFVGASAVSGVGYSALYAKILRAGLARGLPFEDAELYARYTVLGKVPQALGQLRFHLGRWRGRTAPLYVYKHAPGRAPTRRP
jgi:GT2 family glycosyltransferase